MANVDTPPKFKEGDILYARVQHAGCSYYHLFIRVGKPTKTGRYRAHFINSKHGDPVSDDVHHVYKPVSPDPTRDVGDKSFLLMPNGYKKGPSARTGLRFEKYEPTLLLFDYTDYSDNGY